MSTLVERKKRADAIRILAMDAVEKAHSGHPGMPMGMADIAEVLWHDFLSHNPSNPAWVNRDRFILSNGHGAMLQYALLYLTGYELSLADLQAFRQPHSKTPGHPEFGETPGVETTTGPLAQGLGHAVGMALASALLAEQYNRPQHEIIDHFIYCFVGDGCLMEGLSHEVSSLAGTLGLGRLIVFWDDNQISIDGNVKGWWRDQTPARFESYGWHVIRDLDGHDPEAIRAAILNAQQVNDRPSLLCCRTIIGQGAPTAAGQASTHGSPLGPQEVAQTHRALGWSEAPFSIPEAVYVTWDAKTTGMVKENAWQIRWGVYREAYPELATELDRRWSSILPDNWDQEWLSLLMHWIHAPPNLATRQASQSILATLVPALPELIGGSADLSESNGTLTALHQVIKPKQVAGNYLHYGVREFGMTTMLCGMALYGGIIPYGGTFLVFCDYARSAVRMAAILKQRVILVYTHDSVGLGEDGPTHQPIEHLSMLRLTPGMTLWRPADSIETAIAWRQAILHTTGPTALALTRQKCVGIPRTAQMIALIEKGAYIIWEAPEAGQNALPVAVLLATGSEVAVAIDAAKRLQGQGVTVRVVSMPSWEIFLRQPGDYQNAVMLPQVKVRTAVEAGATGLWYRWVGAEGRIVGIDRYGLSGPGQAVMADLGITPEAVVNATLDQMSELIGKTDAKNRN